MQIKKITRLFRVYFTKTNDSDEDYLIDHSIISVSRFSHMTWVWSSTRNLFLTNTCSFSLLSEPPPQSIHTKVPD